MFEVVSYSLVAMVTLGSLGVGIGWIVAYFKNRKFRKFLEGEED